MPRTKQLLDAHTPGLTIAQPPSTVVESSPPLGGSRLHPRQLAAALAEGESLDPPSFTDEPRAISNLMKLLRTPI